MLWHDLADAQDLVSFLFHFTAGNGEVRSEDVEKHYSFAMRQLNSREWDFHLNSESVVPVEFFQSGGLLWLRGAGGQESSKGT